MMDNRGQMQVANMAISVVVVFVVLSIGMAIVANVQGNTAVTGISVPFNSLWPMAVAGVAVLAVIIGAAKLVQAR